MILWLATCQLGTSAHAATTTLTQTIRRSTGADGWATLVPGPGEPHRVMRLFPAGTPAVNRPLLAFAHLTDMQITDDESPARVPYLDHLADWVNGSNHNWPTDSAYRAHEMLTTQMTDAMVRAIRDVRAAPATGLPLTFTIVTGDATDNSQRNETRWYIDLLDGATVEPNSGSAAADESPGSTAEPFYWHPDGSGVPLDQYRQRAFPSVPGLLAAARRPFLAAGLGMPWYAALGNHDVSVQGNMPHDYLTGTIRNLFVDTLDEIATGSSRVLEVGGLPSNFPGGFADVVRDIFSGGFSILTVPATPDPRRHLLERRDLIAEHFTTAGAPAGHGFARGDGRAYYAIPSGPNDLFQFICLDSNNTHQFGSNGWIDNEQFAWLEQQLKTNSSRYREDLTSGRFVTQYGVKDKLIVLYAHHTLDTMNNVWSVLGQAQGKNGAQLRDLLLRFPNVILMVDGHRHANDIQPHSIEFDDSANRNGFFEITTASIADWPVQSRLIEIAEGEGFLTIFTTMLDAAAPLSFGGSIGSARQLAALGRELAANDPQEVGRGIDKRWGEDPAVRNARLIMPVPFTLPYPMHAASIAATRGGDGRIELFRLSQDAQPVPQYSREVLPSGNDYVAWQALPGELSHVAAATYRNGMNLVIGANRFGGIYYSSQLSQLSAGASDYWPWESMDGLLASIAVAPDVLGNLYLIGANSAGSVFVRRQTSPYDGRPGTATWSPWWQYPGVTLKRVAAATNHDGRIAFFGLDESGSLRTAWQLSPGYEAWSGFRLLDGKLSSVAVARNADGRLQIFGTDSAQHVLYRQQLTAGSSAAGQWSAWSQLDGLMLQVAATVTADGRIELIGVDNAGRTFHRTQLIPNGSGWTSWVQVER